MNRKLKGQFRRAVTLLLFCFAAITLNAQTGFISEYNFEGNVVDESGLFNANASDSIEFKNGQSGQALYLSGKNWLTLPFDLNDAIQLGKSFQIEIDFYYESSVENGSERALIGNKIRSYDIPGFHVFVSDVNNPDRPNQFQSEFNIGGGCGENGCSQIQEIVFDLQMDTWHHLSLTFDFEKSEYTYRIDGFTVTGSLYSEVTNTGFNPQPFFETLDTKQIYVGSHAPEENDSIPSFECFGGGYCSNPANLLIDNLIISSPKKAGSSDVVVSVLNQFSNEIEGITSGMTTEAESILLDSLRKNLSGSDLNVSIEAIKRFVQVFDQNQPPIFDNYVAERRFDDMDNLSLAYMEVGTWLMREGLNTETAHLAEDLIFGIHEWFPGTVSESAERVSNGSASINATFIKDPGYNIDGLLGNDFDELSAYVYRPTGFYVPAGDMVTITVAPSLVNSGLYIRSGVHANDYSSWSETNRFPLISADFRIDTTSFEITNPFGGGIYVLVPQGTDLGWVDININGAVRSPFYSYRTGRKTTRAEWENMKNFPGPFADFESDKYMFSVWTQDIQNFDQPDTLMEKWDQVMDIFSLIFGRPTERVRAEAFVFDTKSGARGSFPGGYPVTPGIWSRDDQLGITNGTYTPFSLLIDNFWERDGWNPLPHEMGHGHFPPTIHLEVEAIVNVPATAVLNIMFGLSYDEALRWSGYQAFTRDDAAIDWMVTHNFRNGNSIGSDPTVDFQPNEIAYQVRGYAKYVDIADLFGGWEAMGKIYQTFYDEHIATGIPDTVTTQREISRDDFIRRGSNALGYNIAPLMHFWGVHPSEELIDELSSLPLSDKVLDRIQYYWSKAPRNNAQFKAFYDREMAENQYSLKQQVYGPLLEVFDESYASEIQETIDDILTLYYGVITSSEEESIRSTPHSYSLEQNYPNPFNPTTLINYSIDDNVPVTIKVYDLLGREVATLIENERKSSGNHSISFDASNLSSGIYFYKIEAGNYINTRKMTLIK